MITKCQYPHCNAEVVTQILSKTQELTANFQLQLKQFRECLLINIQISTFVVEKRKLLQRFFLMDKLGC